MYKISIIILTIICMIFISNSYIVNEISPVTAAGNIYI